MSSRSSDLTTSVRLRGFNKTNLWAWVVSIDNDCYTSCSFKNCKFMAFDVEEMYHHYSLCNSSYTATHICSICSRGTDTESQLFKHKILQHTNEVTFADFCFFEKNEDTLTPCSRSGRVPSKVVKRSWEVSMQKRQYIKCLVPTCYFVTSDMDEMATHYEYYCTPLYRKSLTFTCPICRGRCERPDDLKKHMEKNHSNVKKVNKVPPGMSTYWRTVLGRYGWARCCSPGCYFIDSDINVLQEHYIYCKDPTRGKLLECESCRGWLCGLNKLLWHVRDIHDPSCARPETYMKLTNWREKLSDDTPPPPPKETTPRPLPYVLAEEDSNSGELVIVEKDDDVDLLDNKGLTPVSSGTKTTKKELTPAKNGVGSEVNIKQYERKKLDKKFPTIYPASVPKSTRKIDCKPSPVQCVQLPQNYISTHEWTLDFSCLPQKRNRTQKSQNTPVTNKIQEPSSVKKKGCESVIEKIAEKVMADPVEKPLVPVTIQVNNDLSWTVHAAETTSENTKEALLKEFSLEDKFNKNFIEKTEKDFKDILDRASKYAVVRNKIYSHKYRTRLEAKELPKIPVPGNSSSCSENESDSEMNSGSVRNGDEINSLTDPLNIDAFDEESSNAALPPDSDQDPLRESNVPESVQLCTGTNPAPPAEDSGPQADPSNNNMESQSDHEEGISTSKDCNISDETCEAAQVERKETVGVTVSADKQDVKTIRKIPRKKPQPVLKKYDAVERSTNKLSRKSGPQKDVISKKLKMSTDNVDEKDNLNKRALECKNISSVEKDKDSVVNTEPSISNTPDSVVNETCTKDKNPGFDKLSSDDSSKLCSTSGAVVSSGSSAKECDKDEEMSVGNDNDLGSEDRAQDLEIDEILDPPVSDPITQSSGIKDACRSRSPELSKNTHNSQEEEMNPGTTEQTELNTRGSLRKMRKVTENSEDMSRAQPKIEVTSRDSDEISRGTASVEQPSKGNVNYRSVEQSELMNTDYKGMNDKSADRETDMSAEIPVHSAEAEIDTPTFKTEPEEASCSVNEDTQLEIGGTEIEAEMIVPDDGGSGTDEEVVPAVLIQVRRSGRKSGERPKPRSRARTSRARKSTTALDLLQSLGDRVSPQSFIIRGDREVTCAICSKQMTVTAYKNKHIEKHNFICWLQEEQPLPTDNQGVMVLVINRGLRAFPNHKLVCEHCGKLTKSAPGFFTHTQVCGKSFEEIKDLKEHCPVCDKYLSKFTMQTHLLTMHKPTTGKLPYCPANSSGSTPQKRQSFSRAEGALMDIDTADDNKSASEDNDEDFKPRIYQKKQKKAPKKPEPEPEKNIFCPAVGCEFGCKTVAQMKQHHKTCQQQGDMSQFQSFNCKICKFKCHTREALKDHSKEEHGILLSCGTEHIHIPVPFLKKVEDSLYSNKSWVKNVSFLSDAMTWTKEMRQQIYMNPKEFLFPDLRVIYDQWNEMTSSRSLYLPSLASSVWFRFKSQTEWLNLNPFDYKSKNGEGTVCWAGGPVWAMAWCPTPDTEVREQYLALSTHQLPSLSYLVGETYAHPSLIQIWSFGLLVNNRMENERAVLSYGLCSDEGAVWDLEWCPSGAQDSARLGLLAAAFSSGAVNVYALPQIEQFDFPANSPPLYKPAPVLKLHLNGKHRYQCKRITWSKTKPHKIIVGGFVNGMMAVWDLTVSSTLLRQGSVLYPCRVVQAHLAEINSVSMSPWSEDHVLSCSMDRTVKLWDLKDLTAPLQIVSKGCCTDAAWLAHWIGFTVGFDNGYLTASSTGIFSSVRDFSFYPNAPFLCPITETVMSISHSDWLHCLAYSLENGNVATVFGIRQIGDGSEARKKRLKYSLKAELKNFEVTVGRKKKNGIDMNTPTDSNSYAETAAKFGIEFSFHSYIEEFTKSLTEEKSRKDVYPLVSANKVCFNPNAQSFLSFAVGYESGLVVISTLKPPKRSIAAIDQIICKQV